MYKIKSVFSSFFIKHWTILLIPFLAICYGVGDTYGFWDDISGRNDAIIGLNKMLNGDGYPEAWIHYNEDEFKPLLRRIKKHTYNPDLKDVFNENYFYYLIAIDGGLARKPSVPENYPQKIFIPSYSYILVLFIEKSIEFLDSLATGKELHNFEGYAEWACRAEEFRQWIENERSVERFWVSVFLISTLSILISLKKK